MRKDELFQLVHGLSPSELRYFRLQSRLHSTKGAQKYLVLFDALLEMDSYDVGELKKKCRGENFLKQLPAAKRYLMDQLLKSLRDYHGDDSAERQLGKLLDEVELLYGRGLMKSCRRQMNKALDLARQYDLQVHLLTCLRWERRLLKREKPVDLKERIEEVEGEEADVLEKISREQAFLVSHDRVLLKFSAEEEDLEARETDSFYAHLAFLSGKAIAARNRLDAEEEFFYFRKSYELWRANPHQIDAYPIRFRSLLENYLGSCLSSDNFVTFRKAMTEMQELAGISKGGKEQIQPVFVHLEMLHLLNAGRMEEAQLLAETLEKLLAQGKLGTAATTYRYNLALAFFLFKDARSSLRIFQSLQSKEVRRARPSIYTLSRIWELHLHMLLDNGGILPYLGRSLSRFLKNEAGWESCRKPLLDAAQRWSKAGRREKLRHVEAIGSALDAKGDFPGKIDLMLWVKHMSEGKAAK